MRFHLAQANIALMKYGLDQPNMAEFVVNLDHINLLAESSSGFLWRIQSEKSKAIHTNPVEDEKILFNMSVWESLEQLRQYVYYTQHVDFIKNKKIWFDLLSEQHLVLWWVTAGHLPTGDDAKSRLKTIQEKGSGAEGFTFANSYSPVTG